MILNFNNANLKYKSLHLGNKISGVNSNVNKTLIISFQTIFLQLKRLKLRLNQVRPWQL